MKKPDWKVWMKNKIECKLWLNNYLKKKILRKSSDESKLHITKTNHNLNLANWMIEKHKKEIPEIFGKETFYDRIITFYYYAIYHSALALLSKENYKSKSHIATLCFLIYHHFHSQKSINKFDVEFIAKSLNKEDIETIGTSKDLREKACYDVHELFEKKLAENIREQTINFVNKIKTLLKEKNNILNN